MKKNCNRCKALKMLSGEVPECELGFELDIEKIVPKEDCPKPMTWEALITEHTLRKMRQLRDRRCHR